MVVGMPGFNCCINFCNLHTLGVAYTYPSFSDHRICKSYGHYVKNNLQYFISSPAKLRGFFIQNN